MEKKICSKCGEEKLLDEFYPIKKKYYNQTIFHTARCRKCTNEINLKNSKKYKDYYIEYNKKYREKNKEKSKKHYIKKKIGWIKFISTIIDINCKKCGYDRYYDALDFHHDDPSTKETILSILIKKVLNEKRKNDVIKELDKGYFLCSNCHREEHKTFNKTIKEIINEI